MATSDGTAKAAAFPKNLFLNHALAGEGASGWPGDKPPAQNQKTKRKANCMKRGVVNVPRYLPNWVGSYESEG